MRKISRKPSLKKVSEYSPILSIDPALLPDDAIPLLVFVNSRSGGQLGGGGGGCLTLLHPFLSST